MGPEKPLNRRIDRAVFDTNIVMSALVFGGRLAWLRGAWIDRRIAPIVCRETTAELIRVLSYPKFRLSATERARLLGDYLPWAEIVEVQKPLQPLPITCRDGDDTKFLLLAVVAGAPLVTGDADLAVLSGVAPVEILSVLALRERLEAG